MLKIHTLPLGAYQTNTYIVYNEGSDKCVVIDPGYQFQVIADSLTCLGLKLEAILLTHGHFDHVGAVEALARATGCQLWMSESDWSMPDDTLHRTYYPIANCDFTEVRFFEDGDQVCAAGLTFTVHATPGHTPGSVCLELGDILFTGDTLFQGACGRTDLPGGSWSTLRESLDRLGQFERDFAIYPGHGPASTLAEEMMYNPFLR